MKLIHAIGKQKKYTVLASELLALSIQFPGFQRDLCTDRVNALVEHQRHLFSTFGYYMYPGCIELCRLTTSKDQGLYCVDGQHRYHSIAALLQPQASAAFAVSCSQVAAFADFEIVVEVIDCGTVEEMQEWFHILNMATPIPEFLGRAAVTEQPAAAAGITTTTAELAAVVRAHLDAHYRPFMSKSDKPNRPNVHRDTFTAELLKRYGHRPAFAADPVAWLVEENRLHKIYLESIQDHDEVRKTLEAIVKKAAEHSPFYLGSFWLKPIDSKVPMPLKKKIWREWIAQLPSHETQTTAENGKEGLCPCCKDQFISLKTCHAGHRVSFRNGGATTQENLIPLCATCNTSMGSMDYEEYRAALQEVMRGRGD